MAKKLETPKVESGPETSAYIEPPDPFWTSDGQRLAYSLAHKVHPDDIDHKAATMAVALYYIHLYKQLQWAGSVLARMALQQKETQVIGPVRVRYSNPRQSHDYETPARQAIAAGTIDPALVEEYTTVRVDLRPEVIFADKDKLPESYFVETELVDYVNMAKRAGLSPISTQVAPAKAEVLLEG